MGVRCLGVRFCAESDRGGWVFGLLLPVGGVFGFRCVTPPPPCGVVCCMVTLLEGAFFLGMARVFDWNRFLTALIQVRFVEWRVILKQMP